MTRSRSLSCLFMRNSSCLTSPRDTARALVSPLLFSRAFCTFSNTRQTHRNGQFGRDMAVWFHPNHRAKFPSLILTGKRQPPFPPKNIAPRHRPNHTSLVKRSIFRTEEVGVIRPDHRVWAIILTPPFEPIDLKKMENLKKMDQAHPTIWVSYGETM